MSYDITAAELKSALGPRPGVVAFRDCVLFWTRPKGTYDVGIYARRPAGSSWLFGRRVTPANASLHAVGRAWDCGVANAADPSSPGHELAFRFIAASGACGIIEVIWNRHRWTPEDGIQPYGGMDGHTTHVHVGFSARFADSAGSHDQIVAWVTAFLWPAPKAV